MSVARPWHEACSAARRVEVVLVHSVTTVPYVEALVALVGGRTIPRADGDRADLVVFACGRWSENDVASLRELEQAPDRAPVIVVSAACDPALRVRALASGADDFLDVPFAVEEFVARANALVRRSGRLRFGPLRIDTVRRAALVGDRRLLLTAREFELLVVLARRAGAVASREELMRAAGHEGRSNALDVHVNAIRQKLGKHAALVETVRGAGYRLRPPAK